MAGTPAIAGPAALARDPARRRRWLGELASLLAFPGISSDPTHRADLEATARWLVRHLRSIGMSEAGLLDGAGGPPHVYAAWRGAPGRPTLLVYGHYDVQPPGSASEWRSPPFRATLRGGQLYARGASDDKGQLFIPIKAAECWLATHGALPLNLIIWLEGEEELGSPHLASFLSREAGRLRADAALVCDTEMRASDRPAIIYGLRGSLSCELRVSGPPQALHSGRYGGALPNPLEALCRMLAGLHAPAGGIVVPGFYDRVRPLGAAERAALRADARSDREILAAAGLAAGAGEPGYNLAERSAARPALIVTGVRGGDVGPGAANAIPPWATARINIRLVADQRPQEVAAALRQHLTHNLSAGLRAELRVLSAVPPVLLARNHPASRAAARAVASSWGRPPALVRSGGTIGPVAAMRARLGAHPVLLGFGRPDDNAHAANERLDLASFFRGVETVARFYAEYGQ